MIIRLPMTATTNQQRPLPRTFALGSPITLLITVISLLACISDKSYAAPKGFSWVDCGDEKLCLQEQGKEVMTFQLAPKTLNGKFSRANYVHPLYDPSGDIVTEDFPKDHRHHRGIFWAWHQLILNGEQTSDQWECRGIEWKTPKSPGDWVKTHADSHSANMNVVRDWVVANPDGTAPSLRLVRETVGITVWPSKPNVRILDFDLRFRALMEGVSIGGSDDVKGYGGFSPRVKLANDVKFIGRNGDVKPQRLAAVEGGPWVDVVGTFDGEQKGTTIMVHPSHPNFPLKWILRPKGSMQNAQWPGREPVNLSTQTDTRLRYRLILHTGELERDVIESIWKDYASRI